MLLLPSFGRSNPLDTIPEKSSSFQRQVFMALGARAGITLISPTQCEISNGERILLGDYSRENDTLRIVLHGDGETRVTYYRIRKAGLYPLDGLQAFLTPDAIDRIIAMLRAPVLGASEADIERLYGKPSSRNGGVDGASCTGYIKSSNEFWTLMHCTFENDHASLLHFETHSEIAPEVLQEILNANSGGHRWTSTSETEFRRSDGATASYSVRPRAVNSFELRDPEVAKRTRP